MKISEQSVKSFIEESLGLDELEFDTPLFSTGALDSVAMMDLIVFVESQAEKEVRQDDVTLDNFDTISRIVNYAKT